MSLSVSKAFWQSTRRASTLPSGIARCCFHRCLRIDSLNRFAPVTRLSPWAVSGAGLVKKLPSGAKFAYKLSKRACSTISRTVMSASTPSTDGQDDNRLPTDVKATHYDLTVRTDLKALTFDGVVTIDLDVVNETSNIVLNTAQLELGKASLYSEFWQATVDQPTASFDTDKERVQYTLQRPLPAGSKAQLTISFKAKLTKAMMGYYYSSWEHNGQTEHYALTQFEPTAARRAFPCFDEPLLKATFAVNLVSRANTVNLSNMPVRSEKNLEPSSAKTETAWLADKIAKMTSGQDTWKITRFETTPKMSTYIVAWANGRFEYLEDSYVSPLSGKTRPLRLYATRDHLHQGQFALDVKRKVLPIYETVFDIEYPLPKLDTLVVNDFDAGAMENWGLITGRTAAFLLDPKNVNLQAKKRVASVQSHEVAHMWFGNITTMSWWDTLYLNEGFASLMGEVIILDKIFPEWKVHSEFIADALKGALTQDARLSSHPIEVECPDANMINQIFDALSYDKAASILRMLLVYVGEEKFLKGVSLYLKDHLYGNSVTEDLWAGIQTATGLDVPKTMDNWVKKMGYPVLTVTETPNGIHVRQDRFLESGPPESKDNETIWTVPLFLLTASENGNAVIDKEIILDEREKTIPIDTSKPYKLNAGTVGVYRVLYPTERLVKIGEEAAKASSIFSLEDRMGLVYDSFALSKAGFAKVSSALSLIQISRAEEKYLVWDSFASSLGSIASTWWEHASLPGLLNEFRRELFVPIVQRLGYDYPENEDVDIKQLRTKAIQQSAAAEDEGVVKELKSRFAEFIKNDDESNIPADIQGSVYSTAVKSGGREEWEAVRAIVRKPKNPASGTAAMRALGATRDLQLAEETFDFVLKEAKEQDLIYYFSGLSANTYTRRYLVTAFKQHYATLVEKTAGNFSMRYLVDMTFSKLSTHKDVEETIAFFKNQDTSKFDEAYKQTLDKIRDRANWVERSTDDILDWLKKRKET